MNNVIRARYQTITITNDCESQNYIGLYGLGLNKMLKVKAEHFEINNLVWLFLIVILIEYSKEFNYVYIDQ